MSKVSIEGNASGTGTLTIAAPNTNSNYTLTLPTNSGTIITGSGGVTGVAQGGTGADTLTANNVILGNGTSAVQFVAPGTSGNVLTSNGTTWASSPSSAGLTGPSAQIFTSSGTFTIPSGVANVKVTVVGGGGNGGTRTSNGVGGGGGGGGVAIKWLTGLTGGNDLTVTVGAVAGTSSVASGTETISTISATGGASGGTNVTTGGAGGAGSGGDINISGGAGATGSYSLANALGDTANGGGSSGQRGTANIVSANSGAPLVPGGTCGVGWVGGCGGLGPLAGIQGGGGAATGYGNGGGGAQRTASGTQTGGAGTAGIVIFEW